ncbi:MAG TPA: winged helix-turn-helix domain-containing protein [Terriglobales bacterium]|nr:winged helix-turn-helix domain-containing protein [Terriglobales bacterium]
MTRPIDDFDPENWWGSIDDAILDCLKDHGAVTVEQVARELGLSDGATTAFLAMLAREGRVRIRQVEFAA